MQTHACSFCICIDLSTSSTFADVFSHRSGFEGERTKLCPHFALPATWYWFTGVLTRMWESKWQSEFWIHLLYLRGPCRGRAQNLGGDVQMQAPAQAPYQV